MKREIFPSASAIAIFIFISRDPPAYCDLSPQCTAMVSYSEAYIHIYTYTHPVLIHIQFPLARQGRPRLHLALALGTQLPEKCFVLFLDAAEAISAGACAVCVCVCMCLRPWHAWLPLPPHPFGLALALALATWQPPAAAFETHFFLAIFRISLGSVCRAIAAQIFS